MNFIYLYFTLTALAALAGHSPARGPLMPGRGSPVYFLAYPAENLLIAADRQGARLRDPRGGAPGQEIACPGATGAAFSKAGNLLALAQGGEGIKVFSIPGGALAAELPPAGGAAFSPAFSEDGKLLAAAGRDGRIKLWRTSDWSAAGSFRSSPGPFTLAGFTGGLIASFSPGDPLLRLWDPYSGRTARTLKSPLTRLALADPAGGRLAAAAADRSIYIWDLLTGAAPVRTEFPDGAAAAAAFSPAGALLAASGLDGYVGIFNTGDGSPAGAVPGRGRRFTALAFSPSSLYLAAAAPDGAVELIAYPGYIWTSTGPVAVKDAAGAPLASLPAGIRLEALKTGATHWLVSDGASLSGWARADSLAAERPDLAPPLIRLSSQAWADPLLTVKGQVSDDGRIVAVKFAGRPVSTLPRAPGLTGFEFSVPLTPDAPPLLEAADAAGRKAELLLDPGLPPPLFIEEPRPPAARERRAAVPPPDDIPAGPADPDGLAVVIGQRDYRDADIPRAEYALDDAGAVREHLVKALGYDRENVIYLENPTRAELDGLFGAEGRDGSLKNLVKPGRTRLFIYYSGHGASDPAEGMSYLVPADARPGFLRSGGFALGSLYSRLAGLDAASVTVVLEACFSGLTSGGPLVSNASPLVLARKATAPAGLNILASSSPQQVSSWYPEKRRGLFTYYFLEALREERRRGAVKLRSLRDAVKAAVPPAARRLYGRDQHPVFSGDPETRLGN